MSRGERKKGIHQYQSYQTILTVGDGDFSFSACLAKSFGSAHNMVATTLDSLGTCHFHHYSFMFIKVICGTFGLW